MSQVKGYIDIYWSDDDVLSISDDDYIIDFCVDEYLYDYASGVLGGVVPNTVDITLLNTNRIFTPTNINSPYCNKIKKGIKLVVSLQEGNAAAPVPFGTFYVTEWNAKADATTVNIYAQSSIANVIDDAVAVNVRRSDTYAAFITRYIKAGGYNPIVDGVRDGIMPYSFCTASPTSDLKQLTHAAYCYIYNRRDGRICVAPMLSTTAHAYILADDNYISSVDLTHSIVTQYDGVSMCYYNFSEDNHRRLISVADVPVLVGINKHDAFVFDAAPVIGVESVSCNGAVGTVSVRSMNYSAIRMELSTLSTASTTAKIEAYGTVLKYQLVDTKQNNTRKFSYSNQYVFDRAAADNLESFIARYITSAAPTFTADVVPNLLFELGTRVFVNSDLYAISKKAVICGIKTTYNGGLQQSLVLADASLLEALPV